MANILTVNYTNDVLDQMRCSLCKGYLSCSPICTLPDGSYICGRCTPSNSDGLVSRALPFELLLRQLSFPCQFQKGGCTETVLFDQVADHESKCVYRSFTCPSLKSCDWEGFISEVNNHFRERHPELVKEEATFTFKMDEDTEAVIIINKDNVVFVLKYLYNVYENCLKYDVRYFTNVGKDEGTYKIQLINDANSECNFNLKTNKCLVFDNSFYDARNALILKLSKCLEILDNPSKVKVIINLETIKSNISASPEIKLVDYELLETIRCKKCKNYLIPPLFDAKIGTICCTCAKMNSDSTLSTNVELIKLISQLNYPCQWRICNFVGNSENIQRHNLLCQFRSYRCKGLQCQAFMSLATATEHLQNHANYQYLPDDGVYKIVMSKDNSTTFIWTIKNGRLIVIKHSPAYSYFGRSRTFVGQCLELLSDLVKFTVTVQFEHQHYNLKSEPFVLVSNVCQSITDDKLPFCYNKTDELSLRICECEQSIPECCQI